MPSSHLPNERTSCTHPGRPGCPVVRATALGRRSGLGFPNFAGPSMERLKTERMLVVGWPTSKQRTRTAFLLRSDGSKSFGCCPEGAGLGTMPPRSEDPRHNKAGHVQASDGRRPHPGCPSSRCRCCCAERPRCSQERGVGCVARFRRRARARWTEESHFVYFFPKRTRRTSLMVMIMTRRGMTISSKRNK